VGHQGQQLLGLQFALDLLGEQAIEELLGDGAKFVEVGSIASATCRCRMRWRGIVGMEKAKDAMSDRCQRRHGFKVERLPTSPFPGVDDLHRKPYGQTMRIAGEAMPSPFRELLVHEHHMTVTVEAHHGDLVDVRVLASRLEGNTYARKIVLTLHGGGKVVLFGIIRINLDYCSAPVREAIVAQQTPLGRVLIENNVLRRIEPTVYLRVQPGPRQLAWFGLKKPQPLYGRLGFIHCDEQPAVELLEIVIE
jgi:chorismate-pyruvate lyase